MVARLMLAVGFHGGVMYDMYLAECEECVVSGMCIHPQPWRSPAQQLHIMAAHDVIEHNLMHHQSVRPAEPTFDELLKGPTE